MFRAASNAGVREATAQAQPTASHGLGGGLLLEKGGGVLFKFVGAVEADPVAAGVNFVLERGGRMVGAVRRGWREGGGEGGRAPQDHRTSQPGVSLSQVIHDFV